MKKIYGYARVSTQNQRLDRQIKKIIDYANGKHVEKIYKEKYTGTKMNRPEFQKLLNVVCSGDTIVFDSVSRMSRNAEEGYTLYMDLMDKGIDLVFLNEPHISTDYYKKMQSHKQEIVSSGKLSVDNLINSVLEAITEFQNEETKEKIRLAFEQSQKEVDDLHIRISEGIQTTKAKNELLPENERKQIGRYKGQKVATKKSLEIKDKIRKLSKDFDGTLKDVELLELLETKVSRNSYYKYKKELQAEELQRIAKMKE